MIHTGDCIEVMAGMPADSVDAVVTDPPYGLEFMGKGWDKFGAEVVDAVAQGGYQDKNGGNAFSRAQVRYHSGARAGQSFQAWCEAWGREVLRVTKPGGYLLAFGGTRTHHRLVCGLEDAGWIIRDELDWIYACLSDDTEVLTNLGWVRYNRASEATHAAAFDTETGRLRWERIAAVHQYDHDGPMVEYGPAVTTLNHRVVLSPESQVPLPSDADVRRVWDKLPDVGSLPSDESQGVLPRVLTEAVVHASRSEAAGGSQGSLVLMRDMRDSDLEAGRLGKAHHRADVLEEVQRDAASAVAHLPSRNAGRLDRGESGELPPEDERREQPSLEGRRYRVQEARELLWGAIRARSRVGVANGAQGRLRDGASPTDGGTRGLPADQDGSGEPREPRSYRQPSRELDALAGQPDPQALRVGQRDRGDGLPAGDPPRLVDYAGVVWCITVPSGAFVARRNGVAFVTGNSGFPKGRANLKPAHEPIVLARKPGPLRPLNIEETRIGTEERTYKGSGPSDQRYSDSRAGLTDGRGRDNEYTASGRWPSNLLLSDPELFDEPNPEVVGSGATEVGGGFGVRGGRGGHSEWGMAETGEQVGYGDSGGYSRFFRIPSPSNQCECSCGCEHPAKVDDWAEPICEDCQIGAHRSDDEPSPDFPRHFIVPKSSRADREPIITPDGHDRSKRFSTHPTQKPTDLMRHLIRLVTPSGGTVLDPFLGSGSTAIACELEGFPWIGVEKEPEYVAIAEARLNGTQRGLGLDVGAPTRKQPGPTGMDKGHHPYNYGRNSDKGWSGGWADTPDEEPAA